jgi:NitT/TauT family transport system ATP-binding protein
VDDVRLGTPAVEFTNVVVDFPSTDGRGIRALDDVSFAIREGTFTSIIGPSGCGKTTLLKLLAGLQRADEGAALVDGVAVTGINDNVGYISQHSNLFPWLTVRQNVEFPFELRNIRKAEARACADHYIALARLTGFENHYPHQLSGGMQKRVSLIRTLVYKPAIVLMDEPFGALDAQTRMSLQADLQKIWQAEKQTVILVTHDLVEAVGLSDLIVVMSARPGRIAGRFEITLPRPRDMFTVQREPGFGELYGKVWGTLRGTLVGTDAAAPAIVEMPLEQAPTALKGHAAAEADAAAGDRPAIISEALRARALKRQRRARRRSVGVIVARIAVIVGILALWQLLSSVGILNKMIFGTPIDVAVQIGYLLTGGEVQGVNIWDQITTTLSEWAVGFAIGSTLAVVTGFLLGRVEALARVFQPLLLVFHGVPIITIAPLFVLFLGIGFESKVGIASLAAFFAVFFQIYAGARQIPEEHVQIARVMGASRGQIIRKVVLPSTLPFVFLGLRIAVPFTMTGTVIGEFVASSEGLGWFINRSAATADASDLFGALIILVVMVWLLGEVLGLVERVTLRWRPKSSSSITQ